MSCDKCSRVDNGHRKLPFHPTIISIMTVPSDAPPTESHISATAVIQKQAAQQHKRRGPSKGKGSSTKQSIWSTNAAHIFPHCDRPKFRCNVCDVVRSMNKSYSNSNVILHYKTHHHGLYQKLQQMLNTNKSDAAIRNAILRERRFQCPTANASSIVSFFQNVPDTKVQQSIPNKVLQSVSLIMFACATEIPLSSIGTPTFQGLVDILGGRIQFASKQLLESYLVATYKAICEQLQKRVRQARTGSLTFDGWSAALGAPIMGVTWHYIDQGWNLRSVPVTTLNLADLPKTSEHLCDVLQEIVSTNLIVGSDDVCISTVTSDNEPATARAIDQFTNYTGSVRCVVHTLALVVNDVFKPDTPWQKYMDHVNKVTSYFNYHSKASMLLRDIQMSEGITCDRIQKLKHDIPTRWHSRLAAMTTYLTRSANIASVAERLSISSDDLPQLTSEHLNCLVEIVTALKEVRRVARQLEADRYVSMSRAPRIIQELYETLKIMSGDLIPSATLYHDIPSPLQSEWLSGLEPIALAPIASNASFDQARDSARKVRLVKPAARSLCRELCVALRNRLGNLWRPVEQSAVLWEPNASSTLPHGSTLTSLSRDRLVLLFHLAALLDINECELECLGGDLSSRQEYFSLLYEGLVREINVLDESISLSTNSLETLFRLFHNQMREMLKNTGRKEPNEALLFWKSANETPGLVSPVPFNMVARALLASQASSAAAERLFSDLGRREGSQSQSLLSSTTEMCAIIRAYVTNEVQTSAVGQSGMLHPRGQSFKRLARTISAVVWESETRST